MSDTLTLPTRRDEDFRYSDLKALQALWPIAPETIEVAAGEHKALQLVLDGSAAVARHLVISVGDGATCDLRVLSAGPVYGRVAVDVRLGEGSDFAFGAAQLATGSENLEIVTKVVHAKTNATSSQVVRTVLAGKAIGTYLGCIAVERGADGTDAEQSVRAMLLDRTATANAKPELEIFADDVKAAHGCAVGELDANGLFYLMSRGLPPLDAKRLMLQAFLAEAFAGADEADELMAAAQARLEAILA